MSRVAAEHGRRQSLINAAILTIGEQGSLDVSVRQIADRAGMSPALAFHYFGDKDEIVTQTMRHLMRDFSVEVLRRLEMARTPLERIEAVVNASFAQSQFERTTIAAWLVFYLRAYSSRKASRLLHIYSSRLRSNLVHPLHLLVGNKRAQDIAESLAAMIDGLYVRHALRHEGPDAAEATRHCMNHLHSQLFREGKYQ